MTVRIGLDLGSSAVRAVQVRTGRGAPMLERLGQVPLSPGVIRDGEIVEPDQVVQALRRLWQSFGFRSRDVCLGLANQQVIVRQLDLPYLPMADLRRSLPLQVGDQLPIAVDQSILDLYLLANLESDQGQRISRVMVVAAPRAMVQQLVDVVRQARLEPVGLDLDAFALLRALADPRVLPGGDAELLIDAGAAVTNLLVHQAGRPRFVRIVVAGGGAITETLVNALGVTAEAAEAAKAAVGMPFDQVTAPMDDQSRLIADRAEQFLDEIRASMDYYAVSGEAVPLERALLTGGATLMPNLRERLEGLLGIPVEYGRPLERVRVGRVGLPEDELARAEPFLGVAIGLALGGRR